MNVLDAAAALVLVSAVLAGLRSGAIPQLGGVAGAVAGLVLAVLAGPLLVDATADVEALPRALLVLGVLLAAVVVGEAVGSGIARGISASLGDGILSALDRVAGGAVGVAQAVLVVWLGGGLLAAGPVPALVPVANTSVAIRTVGRYLPPPTELAGELAAVLDASGLPDVFVGLEPEPAPPVAGPTSAEAARIGSAAAGAVPRIQASACGLGLTGSGVVVAPGHVVTNAHVVAGATRVTVLLDGDRRDAVVVLFDPGLDVALLWVADLETAPLLLAAEDPVRGATGAALGFPGGGSLAVMPAAVAGAYPALGRDIYGLGRVERPVLELRAAIEPGDSGGPFVLADGTVGGLVFGESRSDPGIGYALAASAVAERIAPGLGAREAVATGACLR